MVIKLAYGKTGHNIDLPDEYQVDMIKPHWVESVKDQSLAIQQALKNPYGSQASRKR